MRFFLVLLLCFVAACGSNKRADRRQENVDAKKSYSKEKQNFDTSLHPSITLKNVIDNNGLKQGEWDFKEKGHVIGFQTFKNGILHGPFKFHYSSGDTVEGQFLNGLREGLQVSYRNDSIANQILMFKHDSIMWSGFPVADLTIGQPYPIKGFNIRTNDSVLIDCPFRKGKNLFYTGWYYKKKPVGPHKTYYLNGKLKFEFDYSNRQVKSYDRNGNLIGTSTQ